MAIDMDTIGVPGLLFPFVTHSIETGIIQADKAEKGGFGLWGKIGEPGKVYPAKPASDSVLLGIAQFTQCHYEYKAGDGSPIFHFDFYRLTRIEEALDIGLYDYLDSGCLCLMEWPENIEELVPEETLKVSIRVNSDQSRTLSW